MRLSKLVSLVSESSETGFLDGRILTRGTNEKDLERVPEDAEKKKEWKAACLEKRE